MFKKIIEGSRPCENAPKEGDLYRVVTTFGRTFELRYGYYDERERNRSPDIIYPDFVREPLYTDEGEPFVTMMQDACENFAGKTRRTDDTLCLECQHFRRGEEWFGICTCPKNERTNE